MNRSHSQPVQLLIIALSCLILGHATTVFGQEAISCRQAHSRISAPQFPAGLVEIQMGDLYRQKVPFAAPSTALVFHLGWGYVGGDVYRLVYENGSSKIFKVYKESEMAKEDIARFDIIRKALSSPRSDSTDRFLLPSAHLDSESIAEMSDSFGTNLERVLLNDSIPNRLKKELRRKYRACLKDLFQELQKQFPSAKMNREAIITIGSPHAFASTFWLHTENILVTPTYDLVVIDPY
jgi:hypothetical protein